MGLLEKWFEVRGYLAPEFARQNLGRASPEEPSVLELLGYRATWIQRPFRGWATEKVVRQCYWVPCVWLRLGYWRVHPRYLAPKLQRPLFGIRAELHWRSDWGAPEGYLKGDSDAQRQQSIRG
ncbi:hypothetical protein PIB30_096765 [Stylosanthes scabra]|uniref:Uncharacterized protein n=1 Tax=Stylosanthes scabra TaxID=79078 RepID=A0ABU6WUB2_9FABA|nr:hypothetical protein [Stylosanthes scabra]